MVMQMVCPKTLLFSPPLLLLSTNSSSLNNKIKTKKCNEVVVFGHNPLHTTLLISRNNKRRSNNSSCCKVVASSTSGNVGAPLWDTWSPDKAASSSSFSDILWPSLGAFAAMATLGKMDQMLATRGLSSITIAPLGAVCAVLFITPKSPAARKYNMFMAQIGCAAIGVLAFSVFGPGWLSRSAAVAASIAFMIYTKSTHPPAASLPLLFIDGAKFHGLNFWYALFPGAAGCILISLIQEIVSYMQENFKF
ncbi:hypothetical protein RND81_10G220800 [Saponaria officinalis]|uniref:HPP transmembrane region domain-containing protein n=1 Tax=Saponaria officinalis TaxID=3572 RepID=A0AAW1I6J3_SAPOF